MNKSMHVRGLKKPRFLLWLLGFLHKLLHTGGIDSKTNKVRSSYITGQSERFRSACASCRGEIEQKLKGKWDEADKLLIDIDEISDELKGCCLIEQTDESKEAYRAREASEKRIRTLEQKRSLKHKQLSEIANTMRDEYDWAMNLMDSTYSDLLSSFAAYGHGLLFRSVLPESFEDIEYRMTIGEFYQSYESTWKEMVSVLEEV